MTLYLLMSALMDYAIIKFHYSYQNISNYIETIIHLCVLNKMTGSEMVRQRKQVESYTFINKLYFTVIPDFLEMLMLKQLYFCT